MGWDMAAWIPLAAAIIGAGASAYSTSESHQDSKKIQNIQRDAEEARQREAGLARTEAANAEAKSQQAARDAVLKKKRQTLLSGGQTDYTGGVAGGNSGSGKTLLGA